MTDPARLHDASQAEILAHSQAALEDVRRMHGELLARDRTRDQPAELDVVRFNTGRLSKSYDTSVDAPWRSVGVLNPNDLRVYLGLSGSATLEGEGWPAPPNSALVLPISSNFFEVGIDPGDTDAIALLGDGDVLVYVMRFRAVQAFHFSTYIA